ncbi:Cytoplasmic dynein 2 heavy chain 1 [Acipenser ruthenus]|uniref:Cytoplasmic dynein 2 heavy chain 1 n=1 Tax=Acipenser ruthenus TaxID=7906 RepID=A0A444U122_ACIRT|nr:Cytoplasmic dynein 2 heavy chain 1 [Acipenser ruthenus]
MLHSPSTPYHLTINSVGGDYTEHSDYPVDSSDSKDKVLVFFKLRPDVITEDNLHSNVLVSSMLDSPINTLYQAVHQVFAPILLKDEKWSKNFDPKLQNLLSELEAGLGSVVRRSDLNFTGKKFGKEDDILGILTPCDEFQFWAELAQVAGKSSNKERAAHFNSLFEPIVKDYHSLESLSLADAVELVDTTRDALDDVWRQTEHDPYPETRMQHLMDVIGTALQVLTVRTVHEKLIRLLPQGNQQALSVALVFEPFAGLNPLHYNPYTEPLWKAAVSQYERAIAPAEMKIASKLKACILEVQDNPHQLLQAFQKYKELIKRPSISKDLLSERELLLARLLDYAKGIRTDFENRCHGVPGEKSGPLAGRNLPEVVNNIVWVRQLVLKVDDSVKIAGALLADLSLFRSFVKVSDDLQEQLRAYEQDQFDDWSRDIQSGLSDPKSGISLQASSRVMELDHIDGKLKIQYSDRLVMLLREVAHFYNTIDQQMIPSQRPMMLNYALAFEKIIKNPKAVSKESGGKVQITWDNPKELEGYIKTLQTAAERLSTENRKLRKWHTDFSEKVVTMMSVDLLRQQQRWKDGLQELRTGFASLESQGFRSGDMKAWRQHWNHQLYKALEHQYQVGLEALNENLPEINIDLTFKQGRLQFKPPFEEVRAKYFREMKRFISIPNQFKGVSEQGEPLIFTVMIDRNANGFVTIFSKAENLFKRLAAVLDTFKEWVVFGQVDIDALVEKHLHNVHDWERNFKALKTRGKESERLPSTAKVDCITINCNPVKAVIDDLIQRLFDALLLSLRKSIQANIQDIDTFVTEAMETLSTRPQTVDEIGEANAKHGELQTKKPEILPLFQEAEDKNRLLRSVAGGGLEAISALRARWDKFELMMESHQLMIKEQVELMKSNVESRIKMYEQELEKFKARWDQLKPNDDIIETGNLEALQKCVQTIKEKKAEFGELENTRKKLIEDCHHFELEQPDFALADSILRDIEDFSVTWSLYEEFQEGFLEMTKEDWITFRSKTYLFEEFLFMWHERLRKQEEHTTMTVKLQDEIDKYKVRICQGFMVVPVLKYVRGEHLSQDHWLDLFRIVGLPRGTTLEKLVFGDLLRVADTIVAKATELKDLNSRAQAEVTIREALRELDLWGVGAVFTLTDYEDSQNKIIKLIKDWKDIVNQVGDNRCLLQSLKDSPYYKGFEDKVYIWETKLAELDEYLHNLNQIQRKWVYLEPIFGRGALPREQARFKRVDEDFRAIMADVHRDSRVTSLNARAGIRHSLITILDQLQRCQKSLNEFLEEKRSAFPRFYFIGDDDLLEILGQATNPTVIQSHLKKLFAGINTVDFDEEFQHITAMKSLEGEVVSLKNKIHISNDVEVWLSDLASEMKETLKQLLFDCVTAGRRSGIDPSRFPSQILCLAEQIQFTEDVENAIQVHKLQQLEVDLMAKLDHYTGVDTRNEDSGQTDVSVLQLKLKALILDIIHNIDIVKQLQEAEVSSKEDWAWKKQLRFYMKQDKKCYIQMVDAEFHYTYEYQGNAAKLVHTPLTDKCYLTLTQAMKMGLGGNPYGPAGTGKTESVKALGGLFGRQVLVFNCDEGIDVKSMGRIFVGLVKCGAWGCFDEFNRLEEAVLSAVSMQIQAIQNSLKNQRNACELLGKEVELDPNSGIFITLNPAGKGYGGRQKLPDNLKQLFRPVAMSRPDNELIAEVILYSEGFKDGKILGRKLVAIFNLSRELLTPQQHYDWGLRALKTVLRGCGSLLQQLKKNENKETIKESHIVVQALRLNTMSKLTFTDCSRFDALVRDVFPGVDFKDVEYKELTTALQAVFEEAKLEIIPSQMKKALELYEQLRQRMGVVIVGPSGAGKSTLWRMLKAALGKNDKVVKQYTMNPKAMPRQQLLGHIDMDTREWSDGVLTNSARQVVREPQEVSSWIICDGDIDPEWVESLNSVLDDNRLLTMPSGERIQFGPNVNFLFETHDLSCASPATISRMGMIFLSDEDTDVNSLVKSWLQNQSDECRSNLENWIGDYFQKSLDWVLKQNDFVVDTSLVGTVLNGLSHLSGVRERGQFVVSLIRGLGSNLNLKSRQEFAKEVLSWARESPPDPRKPLDTLYDPQTGRLKAYLLEKPENLSADDFTNPQKLPVIQTPDMQRGLDNFKQWLSSENRQPFILVGPEGCGKGYPDRDQLQTIYSAYLQPVLHRNLKSHPAWGSAGKIHQLAGSMVQVYEQVRAKFTVDDYSHYLFTPCILTQWVLSLFRYDLTGGTSQNSVDLVLEVIAYEGHRLFRDRLVSTKDINAFDNILMSVIRGDWGSDVLENMADSYYVTWGAPHEAGAVIAPGQPLPSHGKPLGRLSSMDLKEVIHKGIIQYGRDNRELDILIFHEVLEYMSRVDRVLSCPGGSLLLAGRSGVGRRTATSVVSHMHGATMFTPKISRGYGLKQFRNDLKHVMQLAGIEGQQVVLLLEDYQFVHFSFLEMVNSLLSSGEVPGLYTTEELEPLLSPLKDQASQDGFTGPIFNYFSYRQDALTKSFLVIHESCKEYGATPSEYMTFLHIYSTIYSSKKTELIKRQSHLQNASDQKTEMEKIKYKIAEEVSKIEERKATIEGELKEVQVAEITEELDTLPKRAQLAAAFITYLSAAPEDQRKASLEEWMELSGLQSHHIVDLSLQDSNFITTLELAVRFGKTLVIQEMDGVEPVLYPLLRRDLIAQGPRYVVQIGDKIIDYNEEFRLFLATRNPSPFIPPDAASVITEVNFTTTRAGLRGQLLALTIQHEKPDLETQKTKLLQQEEDKKIQLAKLEESLLETLATSQGNILENKNLIESLNKTKASSALIQESLTESHRLQVSLDQERDAYLPLAESASKMYFIITDLSKINNMYHFSLAAFLRLFQRALQSKKVILTC